MGTAHQHLSTITACIAALLWCAPPAPAQEAAPEWLRGMVWYHIVPDRFHRSAARQAALDAGRIAGVTVAWTADTSDATAGGPASAVRFGGDLAGIMERLDYMQDLGVTGIILSPVSAAGSRDGGDVVAHHHIDPLLGPVPDESVDADTAMPGPSTHWITTAADRAFIDLIRAVHARGMKIMIEAQFDYVGRDHWAVRQVMQQGRRSPFTAWFDVSPPLGEGDSSVPSFHGMWGVDAWPRFAADSLRPPFTLDMHLRDAVRRWMDPDADGNPVDGVDAWLIHQHGRYSAAWWREWVRFVRSINPAAAVLGDDVDPPIPGALAGSHPFDAGTDARFARAVVNTVVRRKGTPTYLDKTLSDLRADIDGVATDGRLTWVGNTETPRLAGMIMNPAIPFHTGATTASAGIVHHGRPTAEDQRVQRLVAMLQFLLPGSPVVFYGDEAGLPGWDEPDNLRPMPWPGQAGWPASGVFDSLLHRYYRQLASLRAGHIALRVGSMQTLALDDAAGIHAFARDAGADKVFAVINIGTEARECRLHVPGLPDGLRVDEVLTGIPFHAQKEYLSFIIPPNSGMVLVPSY